MDGTRLTALAVVAVALVAFVPIANSLNEVRLGDVKPPVEIKDPPPVDPPPFQPPPVTPPCEPGAQEAASGRYAATDTGDGRARFEVPEGSRILNVQWIWSQYRGTSSLEIADPDGNVLVDEGTTFPATLVAARTDQGEQDLEAVVGSWTVTTANQGLAGEWGFLVTILGCFPPATGGGA